jgi:hypothetical protein
VSSSGILYEAVNTVKTSLTVLGLVPVTDPRNVRPLSVLIQLPSSNNFNYNVGDIDIRIQVCAPPPGNQDAGDYLMQIADQIMNSAMAITDMRPGMLSIGGQDLPTYDLTVRVAVNRQP